MNRSRYEASLAARMSFYQARLAAAPENERQMIHRKILALRVARVRPQAELTMICHLSARGSAKDALFRLMFE